LTLPQTDTVGSAGLEVADVLERAAELLSAPGAWIKGSWQSGHCVCAEGAILAVVPARNRTFAYLAIKFLEELLPIPAIEGKRIVPFWNDAPERTQAEVVAKLREAAALSRAGKSS
jgi:hypothetical protein